MKEQIENSIKTFVGTTQRLAPLLALAFFSIASLSCDAASAWSEYESGDAKLEGGQIFYRESHLSSPDAESKTAGSSQLVRYVRPNGETFAELTSIPTTNRLLPDTHFEDHRDHYEYKMTLHAEDQNKSQSQPRSLADHEKSSVEFSVRDSDKEPWKTSKEDIKPNTFVLQTLPLFLAEHETEIQSLQRFEANLAIPSRRTIERVRLTPTRIQSSTEPQDSSKLTSGSKKAAARVFEIRMEPASFLLRKLLPESIVIYDLDAHRVTEFRGVSNILDDHDKPKHVTIQYHKN